MAIVLLLVLSVFLIVINFFPLLVEENRRGKEFPKATVVNENRAIQGDNLDKNSIKYLYGVPVSTRDEIDEWWVVKGFSDALCEHLNELIHIANDGRCENYVALIEDWNTYYGRLRALCIRHKL